MEDLAPVNRVFVKRTRRGVVKTHVRQHYLRDDLPTGSPHLDGPELEPRLSASAARYIVLDTNVVLHQMDVLEHRGVECGVLDRLVICQTVAEEVRRNDRDVFRRLCASSGVPRKPGRGEGRPITMRFGRHQFAL